jgi:hypothetical protein
MGIDCVAQYLALKIVYTVSPSIAQYLAFNNGVDCVGEYLSINAGVDCVAQYDIRYLLIECKRAYTVQ